MKVGFLELFRKDNPQSLAYVKSLMEMAIADGKFHVHERELLRSIAKQNRISDVRLAELERSGEPIDLEIPNTKKERFHQLYHLVLMMTIDNFIHEHEFELCKWFVDKFGFSRERSGEIVESIRLNIQNGKTAEEAYGRLNYLINHC